MVDRVGVAATAVSIHGHDQRGFGPFNDPVKPGAKESVNEKFRSLKVLGYEIKQRTARLEVLVPHSGCIPLKCLGERINSDIKSSEVSQSGHDIGIPSIVALPCHCGQSGCFGAGRQQQIEGSRTGPFHQFKTRGMAR